MELKGLLIISILIWVQVVSINADTDPSDASALNVLFQSMNSPAELAGWSATGNDPCGQTWKGVTCSGSRVTQIQISGLGVAGSLGYQLTSLTSLTELDVSNNDLGGTIPYNLPPHLQRLNIGNNNFSGGIPYSISQMPNLTYLNIGHNQLNEQLDDMFGQLSSLTEMDISHNSIPGPLPQTLSNLSSLNSLYLQNNQLTGTIDVLANLTTLQNLNVANNHFTGWIPGQLQNINIQTDGNSWNTGPAPPSPPGSPHHSRTHSKSKIPSDESGENRKSGLSGGGIAGIVISIILVVVGAITAFFLIKKRARQPQQRDVEKADNNYNVKPFITIPADEVPAEEKTVQTFPAIKTMTIDPAATISLKPPPLGPQKSFDREKEVSVLSNSVVMKKITPIPPNVRSYSIAELQIATGSFSYENLLGEGSLGSVYRAEFENDMVLAVKKVNSSAISSSSDDFTEIVANISRLHHPNITELVGYCSEHGQHLLVYEFHKNGSLHEFLHLPDERNAPLSWQSRVKIALGSARALEYLHETCSPSVVHKNFKSESILLDGDLNPHVTDSGLALLLPGAADQRIDHNGSAPEVADTGEYTTKSDVYGFGVVMLELLTGRKPFDSSRPRSKQSLVRWATPQLHDIDALTNMVDPLLEGLYPVKSLSSFADVIALCLQPEPEFRPPMSEVVQALVQLVQRANLSRRTTF